MLRRIFTAFICLFFLQNFAAVAEVKGLKVGDTYQITVKTHSSHKSKSSSGGSSGGESLIQRVTALRDDGVEWEYDLPPDSSERERARQWQFPARIFQPLNGSPQLLNTTELEARVERWLEAAKMPRTACGETIFTWNAFRIECDPQTVIKRTQSLDISTVSLGDGATYQDKDALGPAKLVRKANGQDVSFSGEMEIDADADRRERAEADVILGKMMRKPVTLEDALRNRAAETVSGKISVTFDADAAGNAVRRTTVKTIDVTEANGETETRTTEEVTERRLVPAQR